MFADTAPIFGWWNAHVGWGTVPAIVIAAATVLWGPELAQRLRWRTLTLAAWATSAVWAFSLAMVDGWYRGFTHRLEAQHEYLRQVPSITDIPGRCGHSPAGSRTSSRTRGSRTSPGIHPAPC